MKLTINPMDSYGLSKVINEQTAASFQLRSGFDIYSLRIGNVIEPDEYHRFQNFLKNQAKGYEIFSIILIERFRNKSLNLFKKMDWA